MVAMVRKKKFRDQKRIFFGVCPIFWGLSEHVLEAIQCAKRLESG